MGVIMATMGLADVATSVYKQGSTMRDMPFDHSISKEQQKEITTFHSRMQVGATLYMLMNADTAFSPLLAIQGAAFLMTLVRKGIITTNAWHFIYGIMLITNFFMLATLKSDQVTFQLLAYHLFCHIRFRSGWNKYAGWMIVFALKFLLDGYLPTVSMQPYIWVPIWIHVVYSLTRISNYTF
jgi:hypothetical protein